jgi:hypothetical protein
MLKSESTSAEPLMEGLACNRLPVAVTVTYLPYPVALICIQVEAPLWEAAST